VGTVGALSPNQDPAKVSEHQVGPAGERVPARRRRSAVPLRVGRLHTPGQLLTAVPA
jgi:hypothetical protein